MAAERPVSIWRSLSNELQGIVALITAIGYVVVGVGAAGAIAYSSRSTLSLPLIVSLVLFVAAALGLAFLTLRLRGRGRELKTIRRRGNQEERLVTIVANLVADGLETRSPQVFKSACVAAVLDSCQKALPSDSRRHDSVLIFMEWRPAVGFHVVAGAEEPSKELRTDISELGLGASLALAAITERAQQYSRNTLHDSRFKTSSRKQVMPMSMVCEPVYLEPEWVGVFQADCTEVDGFTKEDRDCIGHFADRVRFIYAWLALCGIYTPGTPSSGG